jgi:hypothetical protein
VNNLDDLAKDLLFNAVYHHTLPFKVIPVDLIEQYCAWVTKYEESYKE